MRISSPWRKPETGIYYLNRAVPDRLQGEIGKKFIRRSLGTRDLTEAKRLILDAHLESQREFDAADARLSAKVAADEITAERAEMIVERHLKVTTPPTDMNARWPTFSLTFWLEQAVEQIHGIRSGLPPMSRLEDPAARAEYASTRLCGESWLQVVREQPRSHWIELARSVLDPVYEAANPPIVRMPANDFALMDAWNRRLIDDNARFHAFVEEPFLIASKPRLRPDLRLLELLTLWKDKRNPRPQSFAEAERAVLDMIDYVGNLPVAKLTSDVLMDYRDEAAKLPAAMSLVDRALPFQKRVERLGDTPGTRVSAVTVKKRLGAIKALLGFAFQERWIGENVGVGLKVDGASRSSRSRRSFRSDEMAALFAGDLFLRPDLLLRRQTSVSDVTLYWLFVLGATSGGRIEEIGQAHVSDVKIDGGIIYIDIDDVSVATTAPSHEKSVKNDGSRRIVPVHDRALALGFAFYVECLRRLGQTMLFPDLKPNQFGKVTQDASRRANRVINRTVADDPRLVFHSLRHRFKDEGREAGVQERILDQLCGHMPSTVGQRYGDGAGLGSLKSFLDHLRFEMIDWRGVENANRKINWQTATIEIVRRVANRSASEGARTT